MAFPGTVQTLLSPAELSFLHSSLSLTPPIRPDLRSPTQYRPLVAETDILPSTNGSARVCFSDGTEAIVGVKAEVEKSAKQWSRAGQNDEVTASNSDEEDAKNEKPRSIAAGRQGSGADSWLELSIEVPGFRDDDALPVFLSAMLTEALVASGDLRDKLWINERWHWKLYIDILLLSPPLSYPLPLLSLTVHLALLNTALPRLTSEPSDDPLFDDDWDAAVPLYPRASTTGKHLARPPVTLLVMTVGSNIIFDPSKEELAVAESVLAVSFAPADVAGPLKLLAIRTIDPPSRLTPPGIPDSANPATATGSAAVGGQAMGAEQNVRAEREKGTVWGPPRGGMKRGLLTRIVKAVLERSGVGEEVLDGLAGVET